MTLCVCAADPATTGQSGTNLTGSTSPDPEVEEIKRKIEEQNKTIEDLTKQVKSLESAVRASMNNKPKGGGGSSGAGRQPQPEMSARDAALLRNNAVTYGSNIISQGGHVEINGGRSNVTFIISAVDGGTSSSAASLASKYNGVLLNIVNTQSPGVGFSTAKVNFYMPGVVAGDNIAVYQLQNGVWVQLPTAEIRKDHVVVNMTRHGVLAFIRVPVLASTG